MISLIKYFNENVKIVDIDGNKFTGYIETYTPAIDSDDGIEEISLREKSRKYLIGFRSDEIKSIEVI